MTSLSSNRQNIALSSSSRSTPRTHTSSSSWKTPKKTVPYLSWTSLSPHDPATHSQHQYIENPPTWINTFTGMVTITSS